MPRRSQHSWGDPCTGSGNQQTELVIFVPGSPVHLGLGCPQNTQGAAAGTAPPLPVLLSVQGGQGLSLQWGWAAEQPYRH